MSQHSLNRATLIGNVTRDPNFRTTPTGSSVCSFGIATNQSWTPKDGGERKDRVDFHNIVAWSKLANICGQLLHKGDKVYIEGRIQTRDWKTQDGTEKRITEIVAESMMKLSGSYEPASSGDYDIPSDPVKKPVEVADKTNYLNDMEVKDVTDDVPF